MWKKSRWSLLVIVLISTLILSACGNAGNDEGGGESADDNNNVEIGQKELIMPYVAWASTEAGVNVMKAVLDDVGYNIDLKQVEAGALFTSLADSTADISVGAVTLPHTHTSYWEEYGDQIDDIGVTMDKSVTMGLAVPSYVEIDTIDDLKENKNNIGEALDWTIVGIDPGAGEMELVKNEIMPQYELDEWTLQPSSGPAMTASLAKAIDNDDPVVVTLWEPHWAFIEWDLKYLEEPKKLFGEPDNIHAVARKDLKNDAPAAYKILEQFNWTKEDMGEVMVMIHDGMDPLEAGKEWVENNQDKVSEWTEGVKDPT